LLAAYPTRRARVTSPEQLGKDAWYGGCKSDAEGKDGDESFKLHFESLLLLSEGICDRIVGLMAMMFGLVDGCRVRASLDRYSSSFIAI
jgi:hypothetical protein